MSKNMKLVGIVGHFGFGLNMLNGQTIKTKIVTKALEDRFGNDEVLKLDTHGGAKTYLKLPFKMIGLLKCCENIIIFPAHNGVRVIVPMLLLINILYHRKIHYVVIGGWLSEMCEQKPWLMKQLKKIDYIYVETTTMKNALEKQGFRNVLVMPNFKDLKILDKPVYSDNRPLKLCTFSRVVKEKGIEDAVKSVEIINTEYGKVVFELDIYGPVDPKQIEWFDKLQTNFPDYINYKGSVQFDQTVDVLKNYFALLFPTKFYTEGIPGTILDAYAAGIPVIASKWESFSDLIDDGVTGIGFKFDDFDGLVSVLRNIANHPDSIDDLKTSCINRAKQFKPEEIIQKIQIGGAS